MTQMFLEFIIDFLLLFSIFINILLLIACVFKNKEYSLEFVLLAMISFCVFFGVHEFLELTVASYRLANSTMPFGDMIISEMFLLMASMLVFGVGVTRNKLQKFKLGKKK